MKQVSIIRNGVVTNRAQFASMEEAEAWLSYHEGLKTFGDKAQTLQQEVEVAPAVLAEDGEILVPAQMEMQEVHIPGYELVIEDLTQKLEQEAINAEAKQFLNDTDKFILRHRDQKELGIPTKLSEEEYQALLVARQAARDRVK